MSRSVCRRAWPAAVVCGAWASTAAGGVRVAVVVDPPDAHRSPPAAVERAEQLLGDDVAVVARPAAELVAVVPLAGRCGGGRRDHRHRPGDRRAAGPTVPCPPPTGRPATPSPPPSGRPSPSGPCRPVSATCSAWCRFATPIWSTSPTRFCQGRGPAADAAAGRLGRPVRAGPRAGDRPGRRAGGRRQRRLANCPGPGDQVPLLRATALLSDAAGRPVGKPSADVERTPGPRVGRRAGDRGGQGRSVRRAGPGRGGRRGPAIRGRPVPPRGRAVLGPRRPARRLSGGRGGAGAGARRPDRPRRRRPRPARRRRRAAVHRRRPGVARHRCARPVPPRSGHAGRRRPVAAAGPVGHRPARAGDGGPARRGRGRAAGPRVPGHAGHGRLRRQIEPGHGQAADHAPAAGGAGRRPRQLPPVPRRLPAGGGGGRQLPRRVRSLRRVPVPAAGRQLVLLQPRPRRVGRRRGPADPAVHRSGPPVRRQAGLGADLPPVPPPAGADRAGPRRPVRQAALHAQRLVAAGHGRVGAGRLVDRRSADGAAGVHRRAPGPAGGRVPAAGGREGHGLPQGRAGRVEVGAPRRGRAAVPPPAPTAGRAAGGNPPPAGPAEGRRAAGPAGRRGTAAAGPGPVLEAGAPPGRGQAGRAGRAAAVLPRGGRAGRVRRRDGAGQAGGGRQGPAVEAGPDRRPRAVGGRRGRRPASIPRLRQRGGGEPGRPRDGRLGSARGRTSPATRTCSPAGAAASSCSRWPAALPGW